MEPRRLVLKLIVRIPLERAVMGLWQDRKKPGKFLGKWNEENEKKKIKAKQFVQLAASL